MPSLSDYVDYNYINTSTGNEKLPEDENIKPDMKYSPDFKTRQFSYKVYTTLN